MYPGIALHIHLDNGQVTDFYLNISRVLFEPSLITAQIETKPARILRTKDGKKK